MAGTKDKSPVTADAKLLKEASPRGEVDAFLAKAKSLGPRMDGRRGRLAFALDATMSRQPTWDLACKLQAEMFEETGAIGGLDVQLIYFRGLRECRASKWNSDPARLGEIMAGIACQGGHTQIGRVLEHVRSESRTAKIDALVYVGDAMEEPVDHLCAIAGELGLLGVPAFMFQEGGAPVAENAFREIARLTKGAWCPFDAGAASQLRELLRAAAAYAAGGHKALSDLSRRGGRGATRLIEQLR